MDAFLRCRGTMRRFIGTLSVVTVAVIYVPLAVFPFVQDDWSVLRVLTFHNTGELILDVFWPIGKFFYRPLAWCYFVLLHTLFGLNPLVFHLVSILLLMGSTFLVADIGRRLTGDMLIGRGSGFLFAAAANIHIDTQMWLAGIADLGSLFCSLLSIVFSLRKQTTLSALCLVLALGFKEAAATLPLILLALAVITEIQDSQTTGSMYRLFLRFRFHIIVIGSYAVLKFTGISFFDFPSTHPYAMRFIDGKSAGTIQLYAFWGLESVLPIKNFIFSEWGSLMLLTLAAMVIVFTYVNVVRYTAKIPSDVRHGVLASLATALWILFALLPPMVLVHHPNKYYLTCVLPPIAIGAMCILKALVRPIVSDRRVLAAACWVFVLANVVDGTVVIQRRISLGIHDGAHASSMHGDNNLIRKASVVRAVWKPLLALLPSLPAHSTLVMEGVDTGTFTNSNGLQVWYRDSTLRVAELVPEAFTQPSIVRLALPRDPRWNELASRELIDVPIERVFCVLFNGDSLSRVDIRDLVPPDSRKKVSSPPLP